MSFEATSNGAALATQLAKAAGELRDLEGVNREAGNLIAGAPGPRRTGATVAGVRASVTPTEVTVAGTTRNWSFTHWGAPGRHVKAQPWLRSYVAGNTSKLTQLYEDYAADVVAQVNG